MNSILPFLGIVFALALGSVAQAENEADARRDFKLRVRNAHFDPEAMLWKQLSLAKYGPPMTKEILEDTRLPWALTNAFMKSMQVSLEDLRAFEAALKECASTEPSLKYYFMNSAKNLYCDAESTHSFRKMFKHTLFGEDARSMGMRVQTLFTGFGSVINKHGPVDYFANCRNITEDAFGSYGSTLMKKYCQDIDLAGVECTNERCVIHLGFEG